NDKIDSHKIASLLRGACGRKPTCIRPRCGRLATCSDGACTRCASVASCWHIFRTRAPSTTFRSSSAGWRTRPIAMACPTIFLMPASARASRWTSRCSSYDGLITDLELTLVRDAKRHDGDAFHRLRSVPGIGKVLALTILYEIHDIHRFDRVQEFASYARLVKCAHQSAGKTYGTGGA